MPVHITTNGDEFVVQALDRSYKGKTAEVFKVDKNGVTTVAGKVPYTGSIYSVVQVGRATAGGLTLTGALIGDQVEAIANLTTPGDLQSSFETVVTVAGQLQQSTATDLSAKQILFILNHPAA
jgi:hypothetical protein